MYTMYIEMYPVKVAAFQTTLSSMQACSLDVAEVVVVLSFCFIQPQIKIDGRND